MLIYLVANCGKYVYAEVAESADALDSGSSECKFMRVQVPSSAPKSHRYSAGFFVAGEAAYFIS